MMDFFLLSTSTVKQLHEGINLPISLLNTHEFRLKLVQFNTIKSNRVTKWLFDAGLMRHRHIPALIMLCVRWAANSHSALLAHVESVC